MTMTVLGEVASAATSTPAPQERCKFGLCRRPAEHLVLTTDDMTNELRDVVVCGLHVTPAVAWGRVTDVKEVTIRPI